MARKLSKDKGLPFFFWGVSSAGRALRWQRRGQGFEPPTLHQSSFKPLFKGFFCALLVICCFVTQQHTKSFK